MTKQDVRCFIDIFRFVQLVLRYQHYWVGCPSAVGYQPTLARKAICKSASPTTEGSITSIQAVYVPADDLTDPAPATTFALLLQLLCLRGLASKGIYPVDPLDSTSTMLQSSVVGDEHYNTARPVNATAIKNFKTSSPFWVWMNCLRMTESEHGSLRASCLNRSLWQKSSPVRLVSM